MLLGTQSTRTNAQTHTHARTHIVRHLSPSSLCAITSPHRTSTSTTNDVDDDGARTLSSNMVNGL